MQTLEDKLKSVKDSGTDYYGKRLYSELEFAIELSKAKSGKYDDLIDKAMDYSVAEVSKTGSISEEICSHAENMLFQVAKEAKRYRVICAAHAHIDMNWMWRWDETAAVALDTFRTMLNLMDEYPDFKFSQSQASVYRIMEDYDPDMLSEVKKRIDEGKWEVTASTWVECDKNMPNGESLSRQLLYTKKYLSKLLGIDPNSLKIDFEPDTFGHSVNIPEILSDGGVKYYYHCRGYEGYNIYRWTAPSGKSVIAYHEPYGYNSDINPSMFLFVPEFCRNYNINTALKVYGVGDHGGGPTRRDIERIIDMNKWPVFPRIEFGTFHEYFNYLDNSGADFPEVKGELNFVFTGCYTTQSRIKAGNRITEAVLNEAEAFSALSSLYTGFKYRNGSFSKAWEDVLFNQFHDIIPGSGIIDTREYAMGNYQRALAIANSEKSKALRNIANLIDTREYADPDIDIKETTSEGAGVGFGVSDFKISQCDRGKGTKRVFTVFNPADIDREENVEITVWDWQGNIESIIFMDSYGNIVPHMLLKNGFDYYWGHSYIKILLEVKVPSYGYSTYVMDGGGREIEVPRSEYPRVEKEDNFILENSRVKIVFDKNNASIRSFIDKKSGEEMIDAAKPSGIFRLIEEDTDKQMTAWIVGRYMNITNLNRDVRIKNISYPSGNLRQGIHYEIPFRNSYLKVDAYLDDNSTALKYDVECRWLEVGENGVCIPQLNFIMPVNYKVASYVYDVPFGTIERQPMDMDVPAGNFALAKRSERGKKAVMLVTNNKYGFRGFENSIAVTLIRSSYDPDPYPELGVHKFSFEIQLADGTSRRALIDSSYCFNHPMSTLPVGVHGGKLKKINGFVSLEEGNVAVSAIKVPEGEPSSESDVKNRLIMRIYETEGKNGNAVFKFYSEPKRAYFMDINENIIETDSTIEIMGEKVKFDIKPYSIANICIEF
ncbi:MAG TPA: alpha-mannosidase [Clostridiaceae bacterium]|nr:alpha-mannosidase [Clostridiaceae bacterium]